MTDQQADLGRQQYLVPGLIGMSVHTDCVYLQQINRAAAQDGGEPQVSSTKMILHAINFRQLTSELNNGRRAEAESVIRQAVAAVQQAGAGFLVVTANTVNSMLRDLQDAVSVPVLDIARPVFVEARDRNLSRLGLLSTKQTAASGMYQDRAEEFGASIITPPPVVAEAVNEAIFHRLVRGICTDEDAKTVLHAVAWFAQQGAEAVILGCTDLTLLIDRLGTACLPLLDSTVLHAHAAYRMAMTGDIEQYAVRDPAANWPGALSLRRDAQTS